MSGFRTIEWIGEKVRLIDQTKLPLEEVFIECSDYRTLAEAIQAMKIRGAPALGVAAAFGLALVACRSQALSTYELLNDLRVASIILGRTRPTAVNLRWAIERIKQKAEENQRTSLDRLKKIIIAEAIKIAEEDREINLKMGKLGSSLISDGDVILTYCNTGTLAATDYGTALGVIRTAWEEGKKIKVYVCETRPLLQGSRLTMWELKKLGIPATLITDGAAGYFMSRGVISKVMVGADRIAANGDVANKIGTYMLAVLARENKLPFYVVAPVSSIDLNTRSGEDIPIEERSPEEVTQVMNTQIAPRGVSVSNPAFDLTPHQFITAIITERKIVHPPYKKTLKTLVEGF